jgi:hypothetical protein
MIPEDGFFAAPIEPGATVRVGWDSQDLHLLTR